MVERRCSIGLTAVLACALGTAACHGSRHAQADALLAEIQRLGPRPVLDSLWAGRAGARPLAVFDSIATGDAAWLRVATALSPAADPWTAEHLYPALALALPRAPARVLAAVGPEMPLHRVCVPAFADTAPGYRERYQPMIEAALAGVRARWLRPARDSCLERLRTALLPTDTGRALSNGLTIDNWRVVLEGTELIDVRRRFGGQIHHSGDAGGFRAWLCYQLADDAGPATLVLESDEMTGGRTVMGYALYRGGARAPDTGCAPAHVRLTAIVPENGLRLGMMRGDLIAKLGRPTISGDTVVFDSDGTVKAREHGSRTLSTYDISRTVEALFRRDTLVWFRSWKLTSS